MRRLTTIIIVIAAVGLIAVAAYAQGGPGRAGWGYGMTPGYHMGGGYGPGAAWCPGWGGNAPARTGNASPYGGPGWARGYRGGYGPANCPGLQAFNQAAPQAPAGDGLDR